MQTSLSKSDKEFEDLDELSALTALDGRYAKQTVPLRQYFSEQALIDARVQVEARWALWLINGGNGPGKGKVHGPAQSELERLSGNGIDKQGAMRIKQIEGKTNHDVKAVEYYVKERMMQQGAEGGECEVVHYGCTSEDINNLAHASNLRRCMDEAIEPMVRSLVEELAGLAERWAEIPMLSRTHGQAASPTTIGKEVAVFAMRLERQRKCLDSIRVRGKMAGAVGNWNAHMFAEPEVDWQRQCKEFVESLGLENNAVVTQIEPHDFLAELFDAMVRINNILLDLAQDLWLYISLGYLKQHMKESEVGSSTMPHKVNPIDFENAEGNLGASTSILGHLSGKLQRSRLQRDLSDSTSMRTIGTGFGHLFVAFKSLGKGLGKVEADDATMRNDLEGRVEVVGEGVQTFLRLRQVQEPYEMLKRETRGREVAGESMDSILSGVEGVHDKDKATMDSLAPVTYLGNAESQAKNIREHLKDA